MRLNSLDNFLSQDGLTPPVNLFRCSLTRCASESDSTIHFYVGAVSPDGMVRVTPLENFMWALHLVRVTPLENLCGCSPTRWVDESDSTR